MKKLVLSLGILASLSSFGTSLKLPNSLLKLDVSELHQPGGPIGGGTEVKTITVESNGRVIGAQCHRPMNPTVPMHCENIEDIDFLSKKEVRNIQNLVNQARLGRIIHPDPNGIYCKAIPFEGRLATADNGNVFLQAGEFPCGGVSYNNSKAARKLVDILMNYYRDYQALVN